ncbi:Gtr1/RagA G protein conserved region-domain-containing protein [Schizophyllum amplum]|uniref:GTP-binding protein n=1 Tax=Schizophyllum amplum TaxID=97359 RepID=A0A550C1A9_9AGAR|nr:Gtr1/RagA G protein conserved region-domain-containing protein [Auriculariopsis ampla]
MGASGSGKTSMRSLIFSNNPASMTSRLGATIDVEQNHVRFLNDLILNLWDCGGQDAFMDSYLSTQKATIFSSVGVLIYVFDVESREREKDLLYWEDCMESVRTYSADARVFLLVHKMDLVGKEHEREEALVKRRAELVGKASDMGWQEGEAEVFGTSIYDESLYKAWSSIVHTLIPNAPTLSKHLTTFARACSATEVVLFERTTFLVIATSTTPSASAPSPASMPGTRYEQTSALIKQFKHSLSRVRSEFCALELDLAEFTAVLDEMTRNTYVLVICHGAGVETAAIKLNIRMARAKFEELQQAG